VTGEPTPPSAPAGAGDETPGGLRRAWELLGEAAERRGLGWRRLAEAFHGPDEHWAEQLLAGTVEADVRRAASWLDSDRELYDAPLERLHHFVERQDGRDAGALAEQLAVDHTRLFVGPDDAPAPPYDGVWVDRDQMSGRAIINGPSTAAVQAAYREQGLHPADGHHDLPDHIATEADLLCWLCEGEARAWRAGEQDQGRDLRAVQQRFVTEHLGRFAGDFCAAVEREGPDTCYAVFAGLLRAHLTIESGIPYLDVVGSIWASPDRSS
jgi:TorA maturation chaperone TorD